MVHTKEYRICMPLSVEEYRVGQLYMIARHSHEQTENGEGVEVVANQECEDPVHGKGQFTEKRIHLSGRLPYWVQAFVPKVFYITEKAWNYYPYTITEYTCSFIPKLHISIQTRFEDNNGSNDNCLKLSPEELSEREVVFLDIAYDEVSSKHYKEEEDPCYFRSEKTGRGPLVEGWTNSVTPIMCSYKLVKASFEVWGLQTKVEELIHSVIKQTLVLGHRQAFAWIDEWISMTIEDVRAYESRMQEETNTKVSLGVALPPSVDEEDEAGDVAEAILSSPLGSPQSPPKSPTATSPSACPTSPLSPRSWFSWS